MKKKFYHWLPTCVLVALIGVDAAYLMKNNVALSELRAETGDSEENSESNGDPSGSPSGASGSTTQKSEYSGYAEKYLTAKKCFITSICGSASLEGGLTVGSLFDLGANAKLKGKVTYEACDAFTITCMSHMGCYTTCKDLDWTMGQKEDRLCRGCGSGGC